MNSTAQKQIHGVVTSAGAVSKRGTRRRNNQDAFLVDEYLNMFVVADGVGGADGGEIASAIACGQILDVLDAELVRINADVQQNRREAIIRAVRKSFLSADRRILCESSLEPFISQMATTAVLAMVDTQPHGGNECDGRLYVGNAGDSRAVLVRMGNATQLTSDHTIAFGLRQAGLLTKDEAAHHPGRNTLYMNLGGNLHDGPDVFSCDVRDGDRLVLTTDGVTSKLHNFEIAEVVSNAPDSESAATRLADEALANGAEDDVTCVVFEVHA